MLFGTFIEPGLDVAYLDLPQWAESGLGSLSGGALTAQQKQLLAQAAAYRALATRVANYLRQNGIETADLATLGLTPQGIASQYKALEGQIRNGQTPPSMDSDTSSQLSSALQNGPQGPSGKQLYASFIQQGVTSIIAHFANIQGWSMDPTVRSIIFGQFSFGAMKALQQMILWLESGGKLKPGKPSRPAKNSHPGYTTPSNQPPAPAPAQNYCWCPASGGINSETGAYLNPSFQIPCTPQAAGCGSPGSGAGIPAGQNQCPDSVCQDYTSNAQSMALLVNKSGNYGPNIYAGATGLTPPPGTPIPSIAVGEEAETPASYPVYTPGLPPPLPAPAPVYSAPVTYPPRYTGGSTLYAPPPQTGLLPAPAPTAQNPYPTGLYPTTVYTPPSDSANYPSPEQVVSSGTNGLGRINGCLPCALLLGLRGMSGQLEQTQMTSMWNLAQNLQTRINALPGGTSKQSFASTLQGVMANLLQIQQHADYDNYPDLFANEYATNMQTLQYLDQQLAARTAEPVEVPSLPVQPAQNQAPFTPTLSGSGGSTPIKPPSSIFTTPSVQAEEHSSILRNVLIASAVGVIGYLAWRRFKK